MVLQCAAIIDQAGLTVGEFVAKAQIVVAKSCLPTAALLPI